MLGMYYHACVMQGLKPISLYVLCKHATDLATPLLRSRTLELWRGLQSPVCGAARGLASLLKTLLTAVALHPSCYRGTFPPNLWQMPWLRETISRKNKQ